MGWASGSRLASELIEAFNESVETTIAERREFYERMIDVFEDHDCDTLCECLGIDKIFDEVYKERYKDDDEYFLEEDED